MTSSSGLRINSLVNNTAADDKQPYDKKAAKLKEKYEKDIVAYRAKGKPNTAKKRVVKTVKSKVKKEEEYEEEEEMKMRKKMVNKFVLAQTFSCL